MEAEAKWPKFRRQLFQMRFPEKNVWILAYDFTEICS